MSKYQICQHCNLPMDLIAKNDKVTLYQCNNPKCTSKGHGRQILNNKK